jgi:hypothetical protein
MSSPDLFQPSCLLEDMTVMEDFFDAELSVQEQQLVSEEPVDDIAVVEAAVALKTIDLRMSVWVAVDSLVERQEVAQDDIVVAAAVPVVIVYVMGANYEYSIVVVAADVVAVD